MLLLAQEDEMERGKEEVRHNRRREDKRDATPTKYVCWGAERFNSATLFLLFPDIIVKRVAIKAGVG